MKNAFLLAVVAVFASGLMGCPYDSSVPLGKPTIPIDPALLGKWEDQKTGDVYLIKAQDQYYYSIGIKEKGRTVADTGSAYISLINGKLFLNVRESKLKNPSLKYSFSRIEKAGKNKMIVSTVSDKLRDQFASSLELKQRFVQDLQTDSFFERDKLVLLRRQ